MKREKSEVRISWVNVLIFIIIVALISYTGYIGKKFQSKEIVTKTTVDSIDDFYQTNISSNYTPLGELSREYSYEDAINDKVYVISAGVEYNRDLYDSFMSNYKVLTTSFIRIGVVDDMKGVTYIDIIYDEFNDEVLTVIDDTRDSSKDGSVRFLKYEHLEEYRDLEYSYLILYNGEIDYGNLSNLNNGYLIYKLEVINDEIS